MREIIDLSQNDDELYQERQKAMRNRDKYVGINSDGRPGSTITSSKSCSFDDDFRSKRAQESIADEKNWHDQPASSLQSDLYGRINDFTNKIKNILEHRKEDESSDDEVKNKPASSDRTNDDELFERIDDNDKFEHNTNIEVAFIFNFTKLKSRFHKSS